VSVYEFAPQFGIVIPAPYPVVGSNRQVPGKLQPESRVPGENRDPVFEMVPDFRRDDVWMPDQVRHDGKRCLRTDTK
jgi:hypothetical protein